MSYLELHGITKSYARTAALAGIDLGLEKGEFLALLGPSGCGKTTLLRIIAGLLEPTGGRIGLAGQDITRLPPWRRDIGLVFQNYALFPHLTVAQNVGFGLEMRRMDKAAIAREVDAALDVVKLRDYAGRRPSELSGGQQQRVAIARAIAIRPRLLLLDEPLSNLDAVLRNSVRMELRELHERTGLTTVMVTHDQSEALTLADRVAVLSDGRVEQFDTPEAIYTQPASRFVAGFVGSPPAQMLALDILPVSGIGIGGLTWQPQPALEQALRAAGPSRLLLGLRPETLALVPPGTPGALPGLVRAVEYLGGDRLAHVAIGTTIVQVRLAGALPMAAGEVAVALPDATPLLFDMDTGRRLAASA